MFSALVPPHLDGRSTYQHTGRLGRIRRRAEARTRQTAVYFTQPPPRTPFARVLVPGSGMPKPKNAFLKRPHLTQHRAAAARSVHRHTPLRQRACQRDHATGPVSAHRRDGIMLRAAIYERDWHPPCIVRRWLSSSVVHALVRDNRLVAIKTAFARLTKSWRTVRFLEGRHEIIKFRLVPFCSCRTC